MQNRLKAKSYRCILLLVFAAVSCRDRPAPVVSFYYWKTNFAINEYENRVLSQNDVQSLYVRYFDVDLAPDEKQTRPVSIVTFDGKPFTKTIIPVVYIKNRVFAQIDSVAIDDLTDKIHQQINWVNKNLQLTISEIQFDCDWTEKTKQSFFLFLKLFKKRAGLKLSATIRLHQVKYRERTGIPPVDEGVLMFYNMGAISPGDINSIYEEKNAIKYVATLEGYPLPLDIALPIFSWGIGSRAGKVEYLLNKMYAVDFEKDSNFTKLEQDRFRAWQSFFKAGYYIRENDEVKIENIGEKDLFRMAELLRQHMSQPVKKIIFYDLDSSNFINYDNKVFQQVSQKFR